MKFLEFRQKERSVNREATITQILRPLNPYNAKKKKIPYSFRKTGNRNKDFKTSKNFCKKYSIKENNEHSGQRS